MSVIRTLPPLMRTLLFWVIIAIIAGSLLGLVLPAWAIVPFATFNAVFGEFLSFCVPLIIVGLVAPALADLGAGAGKWLLITVGIAYGSTLFAGFATYGVCRAVFPSLLANEKVSELTEPTSAVASVLGDNFEIPPMFSVMSALVLSFVLGIAIAALNPRIIRRGFDEFRDIIMVIKRAIVPCLPLYIFGSFLNMAYTGEIAQVISAMVKVIVVSIILTFALLIIQYVLAGLVAGCNPVRALGRMLRAYFTALGTSSSAATIPVTYECALANGVSRDIAGFTIPLCATIHLAGSMTKITAFSMAVLFMTGSSYDLGSYALFIVMLGITMVAAPGVPGGAITAAQGVLVGLLGFTDPMYSLMVALYIAIDSVGTATNVTGDGAIALVVNRLAAGSLGKERARSLEAADDILSGTD
ncbi:dicarboxylate/amino acid:cation symporter [Nanchangia anserum]|uniref:dicarboxylate/amino acid:cation symporter n=1 Tax=Nanchangia anserum TaxID=2692125 RepID=UPI00188343A4|nr:dicarboxylate/amino acid:cation symporter [Nanchangia anserum]QOX82330.1 dicarboxylate/amino acid:cation symporter [Nanchangia anserum]